MKIPVIREAWDLTKQLADCTNGNLLGIEIAAFITALQVNGATDQEVVDLTNAMAKSGEV